MCSSKELTHWLENGPPPCDAVDAAAADGILQQQEQDKPLVQLRRLDWLDASDDLIKSLDYNIIFGSDLTYTPALLQPLALLLKRLLTGKMGAPIVAFIACTHRQMDSINQFLEHMTDLGLQYTVAIRTKIGPQDGCVVGHEPLHSYTVFKITAVVN